MKLNKDEKISLSDLLRQCRPNNIGGSDQVNGPLVKQYQFKILFLLQSSKTHEVLVGQRRGA